jgi:hypothetical protein
VQQERTTADPRRLRLDQAEHHLHRDRGIDRAAAGAQDFQAGVGSKRIRRDDHVARRNDGVLLYAAGRGLGLRLGSGGRRCQEEKNERGAATQRLAHRATRSAGRSAARRC